MKSRMTACLAVLLTAAACETSRIAEPVADATTGAPTTTTIAWRGDGTAESPYFYAEPEESFSTFSFEETAEIPEGGPAPCPPRYRGTLTLWINVANVGRRRFLFKPPFDWVRTIAPGYAIYDIAEPGVDWNDEWTASGPVVAECRRGLLPGLGLIRLTDHLGQLRRISDDDCWGGGGGGGLEEPMTVTPPTVTPSMTCSGGGGGDGGGGGTLRCYTVTIEHYYYYPDTGEVEYRYTEQYSFCELIE